VVMVETPTTLLPEHLGLSVLVVTMANQFSRKNKRTPEVACLENKRMLFTPICNFLPIWYHESSMKCVVGQQ
jgi:hypothetical protein